jgi:hypothetical protein
MSLQDELDALRAEFVRSAPPGRAALYDAKVDELRRRDRSDSSQTTQGVAIRCGTGSSNPALSSGESATNRFRMARFRRPPGPRPTWRKASSGPC